MVPNWISLKDDNYDGELPSGHLWTACLLCSEDYGLFKYHNSWSSLLPVIEKIESLDLSDWYDEDNFMNCNVSIENGSCYIFVELNFDPPHRITGRSQGNITKLELVYSQVLEFIKWYNKRK